MKKKNTDQDESNAQTPEQLAEKYRAQLFETARKKIALAKRFPAGVVRYRRAAKTGPNREFALVWWLPREHGRPKVEIMAWSDLERIASEVPDSTVEAWYVAYGQSNVFDAQD